MRTRERCLVDGRNAVQSLDVCICLYISIYTQLDYARGRFTQAPCAVVMVVWFSLSARVPSPRVRPVQTVETEKSVAGLGCRCSKVGESFLDKRVADHQDTLYKPRLVFCE